MVMTNTYEIAREAFRQIFASVDKWTYFSWGVSKRGYTTYKGMPALLMRVSGLLHKGWVYVCLNDASDLYEIYLVSVRGVEKKAVKGVYCDELGKMLDELIEKPYTMSNEVYGAKAMRDSARKF